MTEQTSYNKERFVQVRNQIDSLYEKLADLTSKRSTVGNSYREHEIQQTTSSLNTLLQEEAKYVDIFLQDSLLMPINSCSEALEEVERLKREYGGTVK